MPTYDYICNACGHEFELFQSMTAPVKRTCPKCGKRKLERLIGTGAGVIFKGSGFYETDYRSETYRKAQEAETKAASPETKGDGAASGDKKAEKTEASKATADSSADKPKPKKSGDPKPAKKGKKD